MSAEVGAEKGIHVSCVIESILQFGRDNHLLESE